MSSPDRSINVMHIALEPPRPQDPVPFDPEVDITEEFWNELLGSFQKQKEIITKEPPNEAAPWAASDAAKNAAMLALLSPQRIPKLGLNELPEEKVRLALAQMHNSLTTIDYYDLALFAKLGLGLTPQESTIPTSIRQGLLQRFASNTQIPKRIISYAQLAFATTVLKLDGTDELELDEEKWQDLFRTLKDLKGGNLWPVFTRLAANLRILYPQKATALEQELDNITWNHLRTAHQRKLKLSPRAHSLDTNDFREFSIHLAILAAQKVKITDRGLELVFDRSQPFTQPTPTMPPQKKF